MLLPQDMFILKKAPHPNAAKLWIDFILSETGQTVLVKGEALVSGRAGFKSPLPDYARDRHAQRHQDRLGEIVHPGTGEAALGVDCHFQSVTSTLPLA